MEHVRTFLEFVSLQSGKLLQQTLEHIGLTFISLFIAIIIGVPTGILITCKKQLARPVLAAAGIMQTIPSIALLGFMIPLLGIGPQPAIFALFLYALLPIIRNVFTGINEVNRDVKEAAAGMGMTGRQVLLKVELPLAMPVIFAGIRTATVINVGVATLAAYIAAGGLGEFIFGGIALNNSYMILAGAIPAALLAIVFDYILSRLQHMNASQLKKRGLLLLLLPVLCSFYFLPRSTGSALHAGFSPEFIGRQDGYPGLKETYGLQIQNVVLAPALVYQAVNENDVDVIDGYSTDGRIKAYNLRVLKDDKNAFPPYYAAPVIRQQVLDRYPELEAILNLISGKINDSVMTELNYRVDYLKQSPKKVAREFLQATHLYKPPRNGNRGTITLGSKIFSEQYILVEMYKQLIHGYSDLNAVAKTGLGGTKICFEALLAGEIDLYPEYTGTGLQVILKAPGTVSKKLKGKEAVYRHVDKAFQRKYNLHWLDPIGFNNTYALMMTEEKAEKLGIVTLTDLTEYLQGP